MKYFALAFLLVSCYKESPMEQEVRVTQEDVSIYTIPDGFVVEYTSFWTNTLTRDTLLLDMKSDELNGRLYWPGPYELRFKRK